MLKVLLIIPAFLPGILAVRSGVRFTEVSRQAGIDFRYTFGDRSYGNILESSGSGVTIMDYNNDGLYDLYMLNGTWLEGISDPDGREFEGTVNRLYRNNGDGSFTDVSESSGVDDAHWSMAAAAVDYDNDGDEDIYLLNYGPNVFFENNGDGTFNDVTEKLGLGGPVKLNGFTKWSVGAVFWDYNGDRRLDVMVGNFLAFDPDYVSPSTPDLMPHPSEYKGQASMLYEQLPDGTFKDATSANGLYFPDSKCMGLTVFDYDDDGDLDIFQGNDHQLNYLFRNDNGSFKEVAVESGIAANDQGLPTGSMHGTIGDIDGDGLVDLLVTDLRHGALYRNVGKGIYEDVTGISGVAGPFAGKGEWGAALFDFDNDGDLDIFTANGTAEELVLQYPLLLENDGEGRFRDTGKERSPYFSKKRSGRCMAVWDYDNDGDLDVIVSHIDLEATPALLRNDGGNRNNWIGLRLKGREGHLSAIGAKVTLVCSELRQVMINQNATSYLSCNDPRIHFGLGSHEHVDRIEILWPDGSRDVLRDLQPNRYITILQGSGLIPK